MTANIDESKRNQDFSTEIRQRLYSIFPSAILLLGVRMANDARPHDAHQFNQGFPVPRLEAPQLEYENPFWRIERVSADFGDHRRDYYVSRDGARAGVVVIVGQDVLLVRQYRLLIHDYSFEIPGGAVDPGETPEEAAIRECYEETGVRPCKLSPLIRYQMALDTRDNPTHLFLANLFEQDAAQRATTNTNKETLRSCWIPFATSLQMIFRGMIQDSFSVIALLAYNTYRLNPDLRS
jgi:ADP-ribose pyrophosphatase